MPAGGRATAIVVVLLAILLPLVLVLVSVLGRGHQSKIAGRAATRVDTAAVVEIGARHG